VIDTSGLDIEQATDALVPYVIQIAVRTWSEISNEALTEAAIHARYPRPQYRVGVQRRPPGVRIAGSSRVCTSHVVLGVARFVFASGVEVTLRAGEFAELPAGSYHLETLGDQPVVLAQCWKVPAG